MGLFPEILPHHRQTLQRKVLLHEIGGEEEDEHCVDEAGNDSGEVLVRLGHSHEEDEGEDDVNHDVLHGVVDGVFLLTYEVGEEHCRAIAREASPGAGDVTILRHEDDVDGNQHGATDAREVGSPDGLVDELVPEAEVEIHSHHDFRSHDDRHHLQSLPIVVADDVAQYVEITHHHQEGEQGEDNKIFHRRGVGLAVVLVLRLAKHERLVGIAERLGYHRHDHRYLAGGTVDAELGMGVALLIDVGEENLVGGLVQDAGDAEYEDWPTVAQHLPHENLGLCPRSLFATEALSQLLIEEEGDGGGADEVDIERIAHVVAVHDDVIDEVEGNVESDEEQLEGGKLQRAFLVSEIGEGDALEGVYRHGDEHRPHIRRMVGVAHRLAQGRDEEEHQGDEEQGGAAHHAEHRMVNLLGVLALLVDEAEEGGLHAVGEDDEEQCRVGIHIGDDTIATAGGTDLCRVEGYKQIVEESADDTAHAIDGGILCE